MTAENKLQPDLGDQLYDALSRAANQYSQDGNYTAAKRIISILVLERPDKVLNRKDSDGKMGGDSKK